jgi:hypothetical protein
MPNIYLVVYAEYLFSDMFMVIIWPVYLCILYFISGTLSCIILALTVPHKSLRTRCPAAQIIRWRYKCASPRFLHLELCLVFGILRAQYLKYFFLHFNDISKGYEA